MKKKTRNITVTRVSPLKNSALISVASVRPVSNWSSMARQNGDSVPYARQEYSAIMKGMFSLDVDMVGTFSDYNRSGYKNISETLKEKAIKEVSSSSISCSSETNRRYCSIIKKYLWWSNADK